MKQVPPINCETFQTELDLWLADALEKNQQQLFKAHVASCPECSLELSLAQNIQATLHNLPEVSFPAKPKLTSVDTIQNAITNLSNAFISLWSRPLQVTFVCLLVICASIIFQFQSLPENDNEAASVQLISLNGETFTQEEIDQAAEELRIALSYLDKYRGFTRNVINAELNDTGFPLSPNTADSI